MLIRRFYRYLCTKYVGYTYLDLKSVFGICSEAVAQTCSVKNVFLETSENSQENTCARISFLIELQTLGLQLF